MIAIAINTGTPQPGYEPPRVMMRPGDVLLVLEENVDGRQVLRVKINGRPFLQLPINGSATIDCRILAGA